MKNHQSRSSRFSLATRVTVPLSAAVLIAAVCYGHGDRRDERHERHRPPPIPESLRVPAGNTLQYHAGAVGVQIYIWTVNPTNAALSSWVFKAPHAVLFHHDDGVAGIHFAGPTWESNDGSKVVGARQAGETVDPTAIPWLLLAATSTEGDGIFSDVTYIQRLNTHGGLAPTAPGAFDGQEALVPYLADYYFYGAAE